MKKTVAIFLAVLMLCTLLTGCGSGKASYDTASPSSGYYNKSESKSDSYAYYDSPTAADEDYYYAEEETYYDSGSPSPDDSSLTAGTGVKVDLSKKIIYTAWASIETIEFEESVKTVYSMLDQYGAFIESSYQTGKDYATDYYGYQSYRNAQFVIRVPREYFTALTSSLDIIGNVTSLNSSAENITERYTDVESRLTTYRTEESRLLAMLEKAETVEDMITVESRLSDVRYQIESLTATLRNWDNEVNYSTVTLQINEVRKLSEQIPVQRSYWEEMGDGLKDTLGDIGSFFKDLLLWLVSALPILIILAIIVVVILLIVRKTAGKRKEKKKSRKEHVPPAEPFAEQEENKTE